MNINHYIGFDVHKKSISYCVSRQSEKFLIGQSRKFLLTAENWKDGTSRNEPGGTRLASGSLLRRALSSVTLSS
jgi:hypothetical protein